MFVCSFIFVTLLNIAPHCFLLQLQNAGALLASLRLRCFPPRLATGCASFVQNARRPPPQFSTKQALNKPSHFAEPLAQRRVLPFSLVLFFFFFSSRSSGASLQMPSLRGSEREREEKKKRYYKNNSTLAHFQLSACLKGCLVCLT